MAAAATAPAAPEAVDPPSTKIYAELPPLELRGVSWEAFEGQPLSLKDYIWKHCEDQLMEKLLVGKAQEQEVPALHETPSPAPSPTSPDKAVVSTPTATKTSKTNTCVVPALIVPEDRLSELLAPPPFHQEGKSSTINLNSHQHHQHVTVADAHKDTDHRIISSPGSLIPGATSETITAPTTTVATPNRTQQRDIPSTAQVEWAKEDLKVAARKLQLLEKLAEVQQKYLDLQGPKEIFGDLLSTLLEIMDAEYGFVAEVKYNNNPSPTNGDADADDKNKKSPDRRYIELLTFTDRAWDAASRSFFRDNASRLLTFHNLDTLFGHVIVNETPLISNSPSTDSRSGGLPPGHPPLDFFLGVPFFNSKDGTINGMVGLANKPGGFRQSDIDFLEPCVRICGNLLQAYQSWTPHIHKKSTSPNHQQQQSASSSPSSLPQAIPKKQNSRRHTLPGQSSTLQAEMTCCNLDESAKEDSEHDHSHLLDASFRHQDQRIQELELANIQLGQAHQQVIRQSAAQLEHFACSSHEIRTPLNCIIGLSSLLQETELNPMQAESMQLICSSSELLLQVVNDVLDYSKLESGHVDVKIQPSNMQDALLGVVQSMELKTRDKNIRVRTNYSPFLPPTWTTDRLRLQQILFNLLGNAFKFSEPDTCIDLKVELGAPGRPSVASHAQPLKSQSVLRFVVKDYGCGIRPNQLENIFKPFVQAGDDTKKMYEGTGLGLAITTRLVKALSGCVYANSVVNEGSEFIVEFPYEEDIFDAEGVGQKLDRVTVLLVPGKHMPADRVPVVKQILESYQVNYRILDNMEDMDRIALLQPDGSPIPEPSGSVLPPIHLPSDHAYVCLIDESAYQRKVMQRFKELPLATLLLTFGPDYTVAETSHHYRDLLQIIPSVLMQSLADAVEEARPATRSSKTKASFARRNSMGSHAGSRKKEDVAILAAEDNVINQKVLRALLKKLGYTNFSVADNGKMAVDAVERGKYDVVLMDVQMPVMDGLTATRLIGERQKEKMKEEGDGYVGPKIVFVTATVDQTLEDEAKKLGAVGFVPKPFNLRQLETCMTELCRSLG